jgi:hypothetical protein
VAGGGVNENPTGLGGFREIIALTKEKGFSAVEI